MPTKFNLKTTGHVKGKIDRNRKRIDELYDGVPPQGNMQIKDVHESKYFFS